MKTFRRDAKIFFKKGAQHTAHELKTTDIILPDMLFL